MNLADTLLERRWHRSGCASLVLLVACGGSEPTDLPGPPAALEVISGDRQRVMPGAESDPLVVAVVDSAGRVIPGVAVTFTMQSGPGALRAGSDTRPAVVTETGEDGRASVGWRAGPAEVPDSARVSATVPGLTGADFMILIAYPEPQPGLRLASAATYPCRITLGGAVDCWGALEGVLYTRWSPAVPAVNVSAFESTVCATVADGRYCWGENGSGQYGNGQTYSSTHLDFVEDDHHFVSLAIGGRHGCGVDEHARLFCWSTASPPVPGAGAGLPVLLGEGYAAVAAGSDFMCALHVSGDIHCGGSNDRGQLGGPAVSGLSRLAGPYAQLTASQAHACGLRQDGTAYCWGQNASGQLGDGSTADRGIPAAVTGGHSFTALAAGPRHTCGLLSDGRALCWGANEQGQLGNESFSPSLDPRPVAGIFRYTALALGAAHSCGRTESGGIACWGSTSERQVTAFAISLPVRHPLSGFSALWAAASFGSCGLTITGTYCWGTWGGPTRAPVQLDEAAGLDRLAFGGSPGFGRFYCGLDPSGFAFCWGSNASGELGNGTLGGTSSARTAVAGGHSFAKLVAGRGFACGLATSGTIYCWGSNQWGALGSGGPGDPDPVPQPIAGDRTYLDVAANYSGHVCAIATSGTAYCWGRNESRQLGDGTTITRFAPVPIASDARFSKLSVFGERTCGVTVTGDAHCWGYGYSAVPGKIEAGAQFSSIAAGFEGDCALSTDGVPWCWGSDWALRGNAFATVGVAPTPVTTTQRFEGLVLGARHACAYTASGEVYCWGSNASGQVGTDFAAGAPFPIARYSPE